MNKVASLFPASLGGLVFPVLLTLTVLSCSKDPEVVSGCTDPTALNYNPNATVSNGSCTYARDQFIGSFSVLNDDCGLVENNLAIQAHSQDINRVNILIGEIDLAATVSGSALILLPRTIGYYSISGSAEMDNSILTINLTLVDVDFGDTEVCTIRASKI